jgi:hypothetical protein
MNDERDNLLREIERRLRASVFEDEFATEHANVDEVTDTIELFDRARLTGVITWPVGSL